MGVGQLAMQFFSRVALKHLPRVWQSAPGPSYIVELDADGKELSRQTVPPVSTSSASPAKALYGVVTPPTVYLLYSGSEAILDAHGKEAGLKASELLLPFAVLMILSAAASALACYLLSRRYAFSRARRIGWSLCGLLLGPYGLLLMLSLQEWPARIACPACRRLRVTTSKTCEHCGALQPSPTADGTEILESCPPIPQLLEAHSR